MLDPSQIRSVEWPEASLLPFGLRWLDRLGAAYGPRRTEAARHFQLPAVDAVVVATLGELQSWLLLEAWWRGVLTTERAIDVIGEEAGLQDALSNPEVAMDVWPLLRPSELDSVGRWGAEVLRNHGADAVCCLEPQALVFLGSTAGVRVVDVEFDDRPDPILLSETEPPSREPEEPPPVLRRARPKPPGPAKAVDPVAGSHGLLDAVGLRASSADLASPWECDSILELRRRVLLDGLDEGVLRWENLIFAFERIGIELQADELRESLVDCADRLEIHSELALRSAETLRSTLRAAGHDGIVFRKDEDVLVLPHYYLRGLSRRQLWRRLCRA